MRRMRFDNREGRAELDFELERERATAGTSAMVRVRNEERYLGRALRSILGVFDEIVVIDNASDDRTPEIARELATEAGPERIRVLSYPHRLARFGPEHGATPPDSIRSAVYFTNWCLSRCRYRYVCKWDGDMVLRRAARRPLVDLLDRIQPGRPSCWVLRGQTVYETAEGDFVLDPDEVNGEIEIFPYGYRTRFVHHPAWERLRRPWHLRKGVLEPVCFLELKHVDDDEFSHWSTEEWITARKRREWKNFHSVHSGDLEGAELVRRGPDFLDREAAP